LDVISFALLGLGTGAIYALVAQGVVLVFRGSGILNFSQGALVMFGAYAYYELTTTLGLPPALAILVSMLLGSVVGILIHVLILAPMRRSSALVRVVATLGILIVLQSGAVLIYGPNTLSVEPFLPTRTIKLVADVHVGLDRILLLAVTILVSATLMLIYRFTAFGRATAAVAENPSAAATLGLSPDRIAAANWAIASALAALAGCLIAPITFLDTSQLVLLVVPAMAASLVGGFKSFPLALVGGLAIGVLESEVQRYVSAPGWVSSVPFLVLLLMLVLRGQSLLTRGQITDRLPRVGSARVRPLPLLLVFVVGSVLLIFVVDAQWAAAFTVGIVMVMLCLSVVVITGFAGQLSLAQYVMAGVGALVAAKLMASRGVPFILALVIAIAAAAAVGALLGLPSLRVRGHNLAIASLGLAVVVFSLFLANPKYSGSVSGITVPPISIGSWSIDAYEFPGRYAFVAFTCLILTVVAVFNVRRGTSGRRLLAVRSNERAAASVGVSVPGAKIYAFALGGGIAAMAGVLLANLQFATIASQFSVLASINIVTVTVVGGVGYVGGAVIGATLIPGGPLTLLLRPVSDIDRWLPLIGGLYVLYVLRSSPDGIYKTTRDQFAALARFVARHTQNSSGSSGLRRRSGATRATSAVRAAVKASVDHQDVESPIERVAPKTLSVDGLSVRFGGVTAVDSVRLVVQPGQVHGLIGPNGAGKTTFIDAATGFVTPSSGSIRIDDTDITRSSPRAIAKAGLVRSFQSVELFDDLTVLENLAVACDSSSSFAYVRDLVAPRPVDLSPAALSAVTQFELIGDLDKFPGELSFGRRRLLAIARAVASNPSVLLLDEPAAGLDDTETKELAVLIRTLADRWGFGVLLVEHDIDMVLAICDTITVLTQGSVLAAGTPAEIRRHSGVLEAYLGSGSHEPTTTAEPASGKVVTVP
jgi:ABC-type branched-subunit amino acid transport system ATPase component/branched-subunit amino acid ABC-type transport system permease component